MKIWWHWKYIGHLINENLEGRVSKNPDGQCLEMVGIKKLKSTCGGSKTIGVNYRFQQKTENMHGGTLIKKTLKSWNMLENLET